MNFKGNGSAGNSLPTNRLYTSKKSARIVDMRSWRTKYPLFICKEMIEMTDYDLLAQQISSLAEDENLFIPVLSNASAILYENIEDINWAGFYLMDKGSLMLGPFQGKVACIRIPLGKGVCGTAAKEDRTVLVEDVHKFSGHIACDAASNSEIVIPIHCNGKVIGVLDIDSTSFDRFKFEDQVGLEKFVRTLEGNTDFCRYNGTREDQFKEQ